MPKLVEFIESYKKYDASEEAFHGNDYVWNDNHGELIRCKDCKNGSIDQSGIKGVWCPVRNEWHDNNWFCADGKYKEDQ